MADGQLKREWIDFDLGNKIQQLIGDTLNDRPNPIGIGMATLSMCIVGTIAELDVTAEHRGAIVNDFLNFTVDLMKNGWNIPKSTMEREKMQ